MSQQALGPRDWDRILTVASGYLTLTGGNLEQAVARAIEAHLRLADAVRTGRIAVPMGEGTVRLVSTEKGLALDFESVDAAMLPPPVPRVRAPLPPSPPLDSLSQLSFEVVERPSSHGKSRQREDAGIMDDE
jgi:hypothetical protein